MSSVSSSALAHASEDLATSTAPAASPFLFTLQIVRLVNAFRKRVKTRACGRPKAERKVQQDFCQGFERQVATHIDKYLGRKTVGLRECTGQSRPERDIEG